MAKSGIGNPTPVSEKRIIYYSRIDSAQRKITKEPELIKALEALNVLIVVASTIDVRGQVKAFTTQM